MSHPSLASQELTTIVISILQLPHRFAVEAKTTGRARRRNPRPFRKQETANQNDAQGEKRNRRRSCITPSQRAHPDRLLEQDRKVAQRILRTRRTDQKVSYEAFQRRELVREILGAKHEASLGKKEIVFFSAGGDNPDRGFRSRLLRRPVLKSREKRRVRHRKIRATRLSLRPEASFYRSTKGACHYKQESLPTTS